VNNDFTFQSQITDWTDGVTRFVGQYISKDCPIIMEYHSCDKMVYLFYNESYTDLNKFVSDFRNMDHADSHLEESLAVAYNLLSESISKSKANES
jgi:uncharacterized protein YbgA (DUF1722 family)